MGIYNHCDCGVRIEKFWLSQKGTHARIEVSMVTENERGSLNEDLCDGSRLGVVW